VPQLRQPLQTISDQNSQATVPQPEKTAMPDSKEQSKAKKLAKEPISDST